MKKLTCSLLTVMTLLLIAVGCSKNSNDDANSLLRTVPADASSVVMINIAQAVDKLGGSTDGSKIKLSKELQKAIDESPSLKPEAKQHLQAICNGESGISFSSAVFFSAARSYISGLLNDPEKFVSYVQKASGDSLTEENGVKVIGRVAVIGNQFWVCTTGTPDADQLKYYQQLNEKQSYASADGAQLLLEADKVMSYVADVNRSMAYVPNGGYAKIASSLIFNDMAYIAGSADIKNNNLFAYASVLNSDMKPAELLLPVEKIDASLIKSFDKSGDIYFAAAFPKKLTKKIGDLAGSMMGANSNVVANVLSAVDGTIAVRADSSADDMEALIQTSGQNFSEFSSMLKTLFGLTVSRNGDILTAVKGTKDFNGGIAPSQAADKLKGAWIGVVANGMVTRDATAVVKLSVDKKSLRLDFEAEGGVEALITAYIK